MKVVITDCQYNDVESERRIVTEFGAQLEACQCRSEDEVIGATNDADAIIVQYCNITPRVIEHFEHCKLVIKYGIGADNINVDAATKHGVYVANVSAYGIQEVANHTMAFLLAWSRVLPVLTSQLKQGVWGYGDCGAVQRLSVSTLGLWGFGRIPQLVCERARAFGMKVLVYDPYMDKNQIKEKGAVQVGLDTLLEMSDYVSVHCPLNEDTHHLLDRKAFSKMKKSAYVINTARGGVICQSDLVEALQNGEIAGAALDVFENEPLPADDPLLQLPNVIATSHLAWYSEQAVMDVQRMAAEEVVHVLAGNPPVNLINRELLAREK